VPRAPSASPSLRASDADRERVASVLRDAGGDGRLTVHELDERLDAAYAAVTHDDLAGLTTDLVAPGPSPAAPGSTAPSRVVVRDADDGTRWLVAIMGGVERKGAWRLGRRCTSLSIMGGSDLDLTQVEFDAHDVHLRVICVMGGTEVRVPDHMNVVISDFGLMGGNDARIGPARPDPGGPTLHLQLVSIMGGSSVKRGPRRSRKERRELRRREREEQSGGGHLPHGH
jgi:hypothetical protein